MQLSMQGEYALRAMIHLATEKNRSVIQINEIAVNWGIPEKFLRKIIPQLSRAGLIKTIRGSSGGVELAKEPTLITALDVLEAIEGEILLHRCFLRQKSCTRNTWCAMHQVWQEAQKQLRTVLSNKSLGELVSANRAAQNDLQIDSFVA